MPSNHFILCHPLLLLPSMFPSIRVFSSESALGIRWTKYWSFSFSVSPFSEYSGLISFRLDWFDLLIVQGTLKSHLQHHSSKTLVLWCLDFFMVQPSHPYMTTGKTIAFTIQTFVGKLTSLLLTWVCGRGDSFLSWHLPVWQPLGSWDPGWLILASTVLSIRTCIQLELSKYTELTPEQFSQWPWGIQVPKPLGSEPGLLPPGPLSLSCMPTLGRPPVSSGTHCLGSASISLGSLGTGVLPIPSS